MDGSIRHISSPVLCGNCDPLRLAWLVRRWGTIGKSRPSPIFGRHLPIVVTFYALLLHCRSEFRGLASARADIEQGEDSADYDAHGDDDNDDGETVRAA